MEDLEEFVRRLKVTRTSKNALTIVITGASSGIGLYAALLLARINPLNRLILVVRSRDKAEQTKRIVASALPENCSQHEENILPLVCDHCSLRDVSQFCNELRLKLLETYQPSKWAHSGIDVLCLNAAVLQAKDSPAQFTEDGLEVTFQTNYLAAFLVAYQCLDLLNPYARIVISTSGLYLGQKLVVDGMTDPSGECRKGFEMIDGSTYDYKRSYTQSKLCLVALCAELDELLRPRGIIVNCFSPGLITTSGLFRNQTTWSHPSSLVHSKQVLLKEKTVPWGGGALVYMALADATGESGAEYWRDADSVLGSAAKYGEEFSPVVAADASIPKDERERLVKLSKKLLSGYISPSRRTDRATQSYQFS